MLPPKSWKPDAIARLFFSVLLCVFGASLALTLFYYSGPAGAKALRLYLAGGAGLLLLFVTIVLMHRPWHYETFPRRLLFLLVCVSGGLVFGLWAQTKGGPLPRTSSAQLMLIVEPLVLVLLDQFLREHRISWGEAFGLNEQAAVAILFGLMAAIIFLPLGWLLQWASAQSMVHLRLHPEEQEVVQTLKASSTLLNQVSLGIVAIFLAPIVEEVCFRGILYPAIKATGFPRLALWVAAIVFAWMHFNVVTFIPLLLLAIVLTMLYEFTGNLLASIAAHSLFNTVNFAVLYLTELRGH